MIFPFKIRYKRKLNLQIDENIFGKLETMKSYIDNEKLGNVGEINVEGNCLLFKSRFRYADLFMAVKKGNICIQKDEHGFVIIYTINIFRFFLIYCTVFTLVAFILGELPGPWYYSTLVVGTMLWLGTVISQKIFFNKMVKDLKAKNDRIGGIKNEGL